jgi:hypothetical protein
MIAVQVGIDSQMPDAPNATPQGVNIPVINGIEVWSSAAPPGMLRVAVATPSQSILLTGAPYLMSQKLSRATSFWHFEFETGKWD